MMSELASPCSRVVPVLQYFRVWPTTLPDSGRNKESNQKATYMTRTVQHEETLHFAHALQIQSRTMAGGQCQAQGTIYHIKPCAFTNHCLDNKALHWPTFFCARPFQLRHLVRSRRYAEIFLCCAWTTMCSLLPSSVECALSQCTRFYVPQR